MYSPTSNHPNNHQLEVETMSTVGFCCDNEMGAFEDGKTLMVVQPAKKIEFTIDCSAPLNDKVMDLASFVIC